MKVNLLRFGVCSCAVLAATLFSAGCGAPEGEEVATIAEPLVGGNWTGPYYNGDVGPNPVKRLDYAGNWAIPCEVQAADGLWHPGKVWAGTCRYDYGGAIRYSSTYYVLQYYTSGYTIGYMPNPGYNPSNAIGSTPGSGGNQLPVCWSPWLHTNHNGFGKVYQGTCRYQYGGYRYQESNFYFLVRQ